MEKYPFKLIFFYLCPLVIYLDVQKVFSHYCGSFIYGFSGSVENSTQHVFWNGRSQDVAGKFTGGFFGIDSGCSFKNLKCIRCLLKKSTSMSLKGKIKSNSMLRGFLFTYSGPSSLCRSSRSQRSFVLPAATNVIETGMQQAGGSGGPRPRQIFADQKAPPGSGGAPHYYRPPLIFDPWCIPEK